jgi:hypothetical protein
MSQTCEYCDGEHDVSDTMFTIVSPDSATRTKTTSHSAQSSAERGGDDGAATTPARGNSPCNRAIRAVSIGSSATTPTRAPTARWNRRQRERRDRGSRRMSIAIEDSATVRELTRYVEHEYPALSTSYNARCEQLVVVGQPGQPEPPALREIVATNGFEVATQTVASRGRWIGVVNVADDRREQ